jgi:hypothetical protein
VIPIEFRYLEMMKACLQAWEGFGKASVLEESFFIIIIIIIIIIEDHEKS